MRTIESAPREALSPWYVTGFVDGEGSFTYSRSGSQLAVVFAVRLTATDRSILEAIRSFFGGIGRIYTSPANAKDGIRTKASCYYRVSRPVELLTVVGHFDEYPLLGEKKDVFLIWREMVFIKAAYFRAPHPPELDELAEALSRTVPRNRPWPGDVEEG